MDTMEPAAFEQMILKLGLVTPDQLAEVHEEVGPSPDLWQLIAALERKSYLTPWQRGKVLKGDTDGFILGGYKLLYKIQSGSFGRVYRAVDSRDGRVVAVKVLRRRWSENEQRIEMFIREGKVGLMLKHPNIVEVLAISRDPSSGQYYIVMEFVEGGNLREILQIRKKLTVAESLRVIEDCANGLYYAYSRGMTHRDIKLTNILISDTGEAKLVDFGLAQFFSAFARTEEEKVDRTVDYAGLERATEVKQGDIRSDIYFLGCVLYECLTGRPPLEMTKDKHARMRKARFEQVRPIHSSEIDGPPSVLMLVETMMALDPKERYQTPSQALDAIRRVRREVEGKSNNGDDRPPERTVFLAEPDTHLQDVLRDGLKDQGYRVFLAGDPLRALDRFHKQPFDGLIVDARTTGEEGFRVFERIIDEASQRRLRCAALLLLDPEQAEWETRLPTGPHIGVMCEDIKFHKMSRKLKELMTAAHESEEFPVLTRPAPTTPVLPPPAPIVEEAPESDEIVLPPPPPPTPRIVEIPPRKETVKPKTPAARIIEIEPLDEVAPPQKREPADARSAAPSAPPSSPRREPVAAAPSVPPPREAPPPQTPPRREPTAAAPSVPPSREAPPSPPPPKHDPWAAALASSIDDDVPLLAHEESSMLPPPEEAPPRRQTTGAPQPPRRPEAVVPPPRGDETVPPRRQEAAAAPRRLTPRKQQSHAPEVTHITHEDPLAPPDVHHWREELGVPEKKKEKETAWVRFQNFWNSMTPTQKSITGLSILGLLVVLFFSKMFFDMRVLNKYDKIQEDMSMEEVEKILGGPGEETKLKLAAAMKNQKTQGKALPKTVTKKWEISGKTFVVTFLNGKVVMKQMQEQ